MTRLAVRGFAISTLHAYAEEGILTDADRADPDVEELCAAVDAYTAGGPYTSSTGARYLVFDRKDADAVRRGLIDLANTEDDEADARKKRGDIEGARYSRAACVGLSNLAVRVGRLQ